MDAWTKQTALYWLIPKSTGADTKFEFEPPILSFELKEIMIGGEKDWSTIDIFVC